MPLKAYLVQRMKLGIVKGKLAAWTIKRLKADNDNVSEETTTGFAGLAPENAEDYTALVAQGGEMQEVAQGRQVDEAAIPQGVGSVSVAGSQGTQVNLAAPSLGTTSLRPGGGIIVPQCTKHALNTYYATDHLGTVRFTKTFDETGTEVATSTHDYEPFGVEITPTDECGNTHRFTGHERDLETGNDYMHFRFFSASMGRFQKPDSNFDSPLSNPQGWNLYSYVKGNPVNFNDPTGHVTGLPYRSYSWYSGDPFEAYHHVAQADEHGGGIGSHGLPFDSSFDPVDVAMLGTGGEFLNIDTSPYPEAFQQVSSGIVGPTGETNITRRDFWLKQGVPEGMVDKLIADIQKKLSDPELYKNGHEAVVGIAFNLKSEKFVVSVGRSVDPDITSFKEISAQINKCIAELGQANSSMLFGGHGHGRNALEGPSDDYFFANNKRLTRQTGDIAAAIDTQLNVPVLKTWGHILLFTGAGDGNMYYYENNKYMRLLP